MSIDKEDEEFRRKSNSLFRQHPHLLDIARTIILKEKLEHKLLELEKIYAIREKTNSLTEKIKTDHEFEVNNTKETIAKLARKIDILSKKEVRFSQAIAQDSIYKQNSDYSDDEDFEGFKKEMSDFNV